MTQSKKPAEVYSLGGTISAFTVIMSATVNSLPLEQRLKAKAIIEAGLTPEAIAGLNIDSLNLQSYRRILNGFKDGIY